MNNNAISRTPIMQSLLKMPLEVPFSLTENMRTDLDRTPGAEYNPISDCCKAKEVLSVPNLELKKENSVYVLTMTNGEKANTFTADILAEYHAVLDEIEKDANTALVLTSDHDKFWSNGINLEWLVTQPPSYHQEFAGLLDAFYLRWGLLDLPTVGCLTGHTYAAGAILASALDFRFMRKDKGWFCFPEIDIRIPFTEVMHRVVSLLPNRQALRHLMLTGIRVGGETAQEWHIVDAAYPGDELFGKAMEHAEMLAKKDRQTYASIKRGMRRELAAMLT